MDDGDLPKFQAVQREFALHIRNPDLHPRPADVEPRRMAIYNRLFYNNIESFCRTSFKTFRALLDDETWHALIRGFVHKHESKSPYFKEIPAEFIRYLAEQGRGERVLPFAVELCHFESLQLELTLADGTVPTEPERRDLDERSTVVRSPFVRTLSYRWPVHKIKNGEVPEHPPADPTWLIAVRDRDHKVSFLESNERTVWILQHCEEPTRINGLIATVSSEMSVEQGTLRSQLLPLLRSLWSQGVLYCVV